RASPGERRGAREDDQARQNRYRASVAQSGLGEKKNQKKTKKTKRGTDQPEGSGMEGGKKRNWSMALRYTTPDWEVKPSRRPAALQHLGRRGIRIGRRRRRRREQEK